MSLFFLQTKLSDYTLSYLNNCPFWIRGNNEPSFCLLPKYTTIKTAKKLSTLQKDHPFLVWILPNSFLTPDFLKGKLSSILCPLYFIEKERESSFFIYDKRDLKIKNTTYKLPPLQIDISTFFFKNTKLQDLENTLFFLQRPAPFYFKGDSSDRLQNPLYLKALQIKQKTPPQKTHSPIYLFFKKLIDT